MGMKLNPQTLTQIDRMKAEGRVVERTAAGEPARSPVVRSESATSRVEPVISTSAAPAAFWSITLFVPVKVRSEANQRCHWTVRRKRFKDQINEVIVQLMKVGIYSAFCSLPLTLPLAMKTTFTHVGRTMDDDNLAGAFKGLRDWIANRFGVDDGDGPIEWKYDQRLENRPSKGGIEIRIEPRKEHP